jgi:hydroxymethylpyrimidine/phosphomethylpyrimidine kinase
MKGERPPVALTIAGSDSGGGAGIVADLKTFEAHGVWGTVALAAVTAQNTLGVQAVEPMSAGMVRAQVASVVSDIGVDAAKCGMLATAELVRAVATAVRDYGVMPLVVDPVLVSGHGDALIVGDDALDALRDELLPLAAVLTPNLAEAAALVDRDVIADRDAMAAAAETLGTMGPAVVLVTGGHLKAPDGTSSVDGGSDGEAEGSPDLLWQVGHAPRWLEAPRLPVRHTHGSGCVLSAAITASLALGMTPVDACVAAKHFVTHAIAASVALGVGIGPVNPGWERRIST